MDIVDSYVSKSQKQMAFPVQVGDTVNVHVRFREGDKERIQIFTGVAIKIQGKKNTRSFTVRKISDGVGVERSFPLASPAVFKVETLSSAKTRRAKLYYLRHLKGRGARLKALNPASTKKA